MTKNNETIGVAGLGLLGRGIAASCIANGFRVIGYTQADQPHDKIIDYIENALIELTEQTKLDPEIKKNWKTRFQFADSMNSMASCDFLIESIVENLESKRDFFNEIEKHIHKNVPIGSNTSSIPITLLQKKALNPERFFGMHWAEPAYATRFLELIRGEYTSDDVFEKGESLAYALGKQPSLIKKDVPGFIVNRIGYAMYREAAFMVDQGIADIETIDLSCRNALGLWTGMCGPFQWMDITGGPKLYAECIERVLPTLCSNNNKLPKLFEKFRKEKSNGLNSRSKFYEQKDNTIELQERYHEFAWRMKALIDEFDPMTEKQEGSDC
jgi:3-hydroxybutyryl-CoA dehydrogenase